MRSLPFTAGSNAPITAPTIAATVSLSRVSLTGSLALLSPLLPRRGAIVLLALEPVACELQRTAVLGYGADDVIRGAIRDRRPEAGPNHCVEEGIRSPS
jgi:hypothetical protein